MPELLSNTCRRCHRRLHTLASRRRGLGPVCAVLEAGAPWLLPEVADVVDIAPVAAGERREKRRGNNGI